MLQGFIETLIKHRHKYISDDNDYVFAIPGRKLKWGKGDVAIRKLTSKMNLTTPEAISSNKLRKHISTVAHILNMSKNETKQFVKFTGHDEKTHDEWYELLADIYQTAKVSKFSQVMERDFLPLEYKGKSLKEIHFHHDLEMPEENENKNLKITNINVPSTSGMQEVEESEAFVAKHNVLAIEFKTDSDDEYYPNKILPQASQNQEIEDSESDSYVPPKRRKIKKQTWTSQEVNLLRQHFSN
uniref:Uncharacterized protein LOC114347215 n=1 Tax=Diabrotica virgifera virgifera TaxID=50390 RepID=A0A6P7H7Q7_DIAVI